MPNYGLKQQQKASQQQSQLMSRQQIMAIKMLGMSSQELRDEIFSKIDENPALELVKDPFSDGAEISVKNKNFENSVHFGKTSSGGQIASDNFQLMLESSPDTRETLQEHLLHQLNMSKLSSSELQLCRKLIENLDENGFYVLAPSSFLNSKNPLHNLQFLNHCISIIRHFDPPGICVQNLCESLKVQFELKNQLEAKNQTILKDEFEKISNRAKNQVSKLVYFFLDNHLDLLNPPVPEKICKKVQNLVLQQKSLVFQNENQKTIVPEINIVTEKNVQKALEIIRSLNPYPAAEFSSSCSQHFVSPDVYVVRAEGNLEDEDFSCGFVKNDSNSFFRIVTSKNNVPVVRISNDFEDEKSLCKNQTEKDKQFMKLQLKNAQSFLEALDFRHQVIIKSCSELVSLQKKFFSKGPGNLVPLSQRQFAKVLEVHESTVSRLADSKFVHCDWGTFPLKYFFTSAIEKTDSKVENGEVNSVSVDSVKLEIENILKNYNGKKHLSDQKIADLLAQKGYKIARRTVAKYRSQLMIGSSYERV